MRGARFNDSGSAKGKKAGSAGGGKKKKTVNSNGNSQDGTTSGKQGSNSEDVLPPITKLQVS